MVKDEPTYASGFKWDPVVCSLCGALVVSESQAAHTEWHQHLSAIPVRTRFWPSP